VGGFCLSKESDCRFLLFTCGSLLGESWSPMDPVACLQFGAADMQVGCMRGCFMGTALPTCWIFIRLSFGIHST